MSKKNERYAEALIRLYRTQNQRLRNEIRKKEEYINELENCIRDNITIYTDFNVNSDNYSKL